MEMIENCFRDIHNIDAEYYRTKGYFRAENNTPEASVITEVKTTKKPRLWYNDAGPLFQSHCTNLKGNNCHKLALNMPI